MGRFKFRQGTSIDLSAPGAREEGLRAFREARRAYKHVRAMLRKAKEIKKFLRGGK